MVVVCVGGLIGLELRMYYSQITMRETNLESVTKSKLVVEQCKWEDRIEAYKVNSVVSGL